MSGRQCRKCGSHWDGTVPLTRTHGGRDSRQRCRRKVSWRLTTNSAARHEAVWEPSLLHERGVFTWPEWADTIDDEIKRAQLAGDPDSAETYYRHWLAALERIVMAKHVTDRITLARYHDAWDHAAERTPHGRPIELSEDDFESA